MASDFEFKENYIYKYVPFSLNTLKMLIKGELWFGYPINFNDPFEGEFILENVDKVPNEKFLKEFYEKDLKLPSFQIEEKLNEIKSGSDIFSADVGKHIKNILKTEYGVSCFSKSAEKIRMWSHYADSHKGLCLVFDKMELLQSLNKIWLTIKMEEIDYKPFLPKVTLKYENEKIYYNPDHEIFLRKLDYWTDEDEVRLHFHFENKEARRSVPFEKSSLKGIILGEKLEEDNQNTIVHLIRNDEKYQIKWGMAKMDLNNIKMRVEHVNFAIIEQINITKKSR